MARTAVSMLLPWLLLGAAGCQPLEGGELITAQSEQRTVAIEVEPVSPKATRLRIAAKNGGLFYDNATAWEIVMQTERLLDSAARAGGVSAKF